MKIVDILILSMIIGRIFEASTSHSQAFENVGLFRLHQQNKQLAEKHLEIDSGEISTIISNDTIKIDKLNNGYLNDSNKQIDDEKIMMIKKIYEYLDNLKQQIVVNKFHDSTDLTMVFHFSLISVIMSSILVLCVFLFLCWLSLGAWRDRQLRLQVQRDVQAFNAERKELRNYIANNMRRGHAKEDEAFSTPSQSPKMKKEKESYTSVLAGKSSTQVIREGNRDPKPAKKSSQASKKTTCCFDFGKLRPRSSPPKKSQSVYC